MSAPSPTAEPYISCVNLDAKLGGLEMKIMDGGITVTGSSDEMTNNKDGGFYSDAPAIVSADVDLTIAWQASTPLAFIVNETYPLLANVATMPTFVAGTFTPPTPVVATQPAFAGQVRITSQPVTSFNVKSGFKVAIKGKVQGMFTYLV